MKFEEIIKHLSLNVIGEEKVPYVNKFKIGFDSGIKIIVFTETGAVKFYGGVDAFENTKELEKFCRSFNLIKEGD